MFTIKFVVCCLLLLNLFLVSCTLEEESVPSVECAEDCVVDSVKCDEFEGKYIEWQCIERESGCRGWQSSFKKCNLTDLSVEVLGFSDLSPTEGDLLNITVVIESRGPIVPEEFDISFYVNITLIEGSGVSKLIEKKIQKVDASPNTEIWSGHDGLHYGEHARFWISTSYKLEKYGDYAFYVVLDGKDNINEADESNNANSKTIYVKPNEGNIDILTVLNKYKNNNSINKSIYTQLKKIIYCDSTLYCKFPTDIRVLFETNVNRILGHFISKSPLYNLSSEEYYSLVNNMSEPYLIYNITYCDYNEGMGADFVEIKNQTEIEHDFYTFYSVDPYSEDLEDQRLFGSTCNLYDIIYNDAYWRSNYLIDEPWNPKVNPVLPLMKFNVKEITPKIASDGILYYHTVLSNTIIGDKGNPLNFTIFEVGDNYIIHLLNVRPIYYKYDDCYNHPIFYDVYKVNKKDRTLTRLYSGQVNKTIKKCAKDIQLTENELEDIERIRTLYHDEVDNRIDFTELLENNKPTLSNKFIEWVNSQYVYRYLSHPHTLRVLRGEANGSFDLSFKYDINLSQDEIKESLDKFGMLSSFYCSSYSNECFAQIKVNDIFTVDKFIDKSFIKEISLSHITSDYSPNTLIVDFCEKDEDCVAASCCHPDITINEKFRPLCLGGTCTAQVGGALSCGEPACINHKCSVRKTNDNHWC